MNAAHFLLLSLVGLSACGGGGGDGRSSASSIPNFRGVWDISLETSKNDCDSTLVGTRESAVYTITQSDKKISIQVDDGTSIEGLISDSDSFRASGTSALGECQVRAELEFNSLEGNTASAFAKGEIDCGKSGKCSFETAPGLAVRRP